MKEVELANLVPGTLYKFSHHEAHGSGASHPSDRKGWRFFVNGVAHGYIKPGDLVVFLGHRRFDADPPVHVGGEFLSKFGIGVMQRVEINVINRVVMFEEI